MQRIDEHNNKRIKVITDAIYKNYDVSKSELTLHKLCLTSRNIIDIVIPFLNQHPEIKSLDLRDNNIDNKGAEALAASTRLTSLNVSRNNIGAKGAKALAANASLTSLNVG